MCDNYEFEKSTMPQGIELETPCVIKQWNLINDINGLVYPNNGLTLVQFDLSSIYNSVNLIDMSQAFFGYFISNCKSYTSNNTNDTLLVPSTNCAPWAVHG